jgi:hypothetical protein
MNNVWVFKKLCFCIRVSWNGREHNIQWWNTEQFVSTSLLYDIHALHSMYYLPVCPDTNQIRHVKFLAWKKKKRRGDPCPVHLGLLPYLLYCILWFWQPTKTTCWLFFWNLLIFLAAYHTRHSRWSRLVLYIYSLVHSYSSALRYSFITNVKHIIKYFLNPEHHTMNSIPCFILCSIFPVQYYCTHTMAPGIEIRTVVFVSSLHKNCLSVT